MGLEDSRQGSDAVVAAGHDRARGRVLDAAAGRDVFRHGRDPVTGAASAVADHLWWVHWQRERRTPWTQKVLTDPVVHLTVEWTGPTSTRTGRPPRLHGQGMPAALVHGPVTRVWTVDLPLRGWTSGIAFHPGGFAALLDLDAREVAGKVLPAPQLVPGIEGCRDAVLAAADEQERSAVLLAWLEDRYAGAARRVEQDQAYRVVRAAIVTMRRREHVRLASVAEAVSCSPRTLQRWFTRYVGVSPARVLRRHRLQDAVVALETGEGGELSGLAAGLGWADHAHFTREFRAVIGVTPEAYRAAVRPGPR